MRLVICFSASSPPVYHIPPRVNKLPVEAEWNTKLRELEEARAIEAQHNQSDQHQVSPEERAEIEEVPERFRPFWTDPKTSVRQRKRALRFLIEDVSVHETDQILAHIRFKGGATQAITVALPPPFARSRFTAPATLAALDRLLEVYTDDQVAEHLNQQGYRTFEGLLFTCMHVYQLRQHHGLADRYARLRAKGMLTAEELASSYGVTAQTIWRWYRQGRIAGERYNDRGSCLFLPKASQPLAAPKRAVSDTQQQHCSRRNGRKSMMRRRMLWREVWMLNRSASLAPPCHRLTGQWIAGPDTA